jgi:flagellar biosynthesis protein FliR
MKDLAYAVTIIVGSTMLIGGIAGNRVAKHYGKSKVIGTIIGMTIGFMAIPTYVRIKNKIEMSKIEQQQQQQTK